MCVWEGVYQFNADTTRQLQNCVWGRIEYLTNVHATDHSVLV